MDQWDHKQNPTALFTCSRGDQRLRELLDDDYNFESCLRLLSLTEQLQVRNVKHNKQLALLSRLFSKIVINSVLQKLHPEDDKSLWEEIEYLFSEHSKPELKGRPFAINNSNSNELSCIAVLLDSKVVGVDLSHEEQDSISSSQFMDQFSSIFGGLEREQLESIEDTSLRYKAFNHLWTLKEAFTKYLGCGLNIDLSLFAFRFLKLPSNGCLPFNTNQNLYLYDIQWVESSIDHSNVDHDLLKLNPELHCYSTTLKSSEKLPVVASIITDRPCGALGIHIDLYEYLKEIII